MIIKDGAGSGNTLQIDAENRADVNSVSRSISQHINEIYEREFNLGFDAIDPVGADDYFFYIKNTGTKNFHITHFRLRSTVVGVVEVHYVTGTPTFTAGTDTTPTNKFIGSSGTIAATIKTDTNTTGLTNGGILQKIRLAVADTDYEYSDESHIIIPPGKALAFLWDTSTGILSGDIEIYEDQGIG